MCNINISDLPESRAVWYISEKINTAIMAICAREWFEFEIMLIKVIISFMLTNNYPERSELCKLTMCLC